MATDVIQAPLVDQLYLTRSPIIVPLLDLNGGIVFNSTFRYVFRIRFSDSLPIASIPATSVAIELLSFPNQDNYGMADLSEFLNDQFLPDRPNFITGDASRVGVIGVSVEHGYYLNGSYTKEGDLDTFFVTPGYSAQVININAYQNNTAINNCEAFLCPQDEVIVSPESEGSALHVYKGKEQGRNVVIVDDNGGSFTINLAGAPTDVPDVIVRIPTGKDELETLAAGALTITEQATFRLTVDDGGPVVYESITAKYKSKDFCDIEDDVIAYINRYGVWDYLSMRGRASESVSQTRTTFDRRVAVNNPSTGVLEIPKGVSQVGTLNVVGTRSLNLNTGYITEEQNKQVQDLLLSRQHFSFNENENVLIDTPSVDILAKSRTDLINYQVSFKVTGNLIQKIK